MHIVLVLTRAGSCRNATAIILFHGRATVSYTAIICVVIDSIHNDPISLDTLEVIVVIVLKRLNIDRVHKSIQI